MRVEVIRLAIDTVGPGEIFGWSAVTEPFTFTAAAWTIEETELLVFKGDVLRDLFKKNNHIGYKGCRGDLFAFQALEPTPGRFPLGLCAFISPFCPPDSGTAVVIQGNVFLGTNSLLLLPLGQSIHHPELCVFRKPGPRSLPKRPAPHGFLETD